MPLSVDAERRRAALELLARLIRLHPVYGSAGPDAAQAAVATAMRAFGMSRVEVDRFTATDVAAHPAYVDVARFGDIYAGYAAVPKTNVIGVVDSGRPGPTLLLNGHVDVDVVVDQELWAEPELWRSGKIVDERIYGRGAVDMLGGLTAQLAVASTLAARRDRWRGKVVVCSVVDEEIGGNGTLRSLDWLERQGLIGGAGPVECLIAEPTECRCCARSLGFLHFRVEVGGRSCHMGAARAGEGAVERLAELVLGFERDVAAVALRDCGGEASRATLACNFGLIGGGADAAVPPGRVHAEGTLFFPPEVERARFEATLARRCGERYGWAELTTSGFGFDGADCRGSRLAALSAGEGPGVFRSPCDARLVAMRGIPTVIHGPGALEQAHAIDESLALDEWHGYVDELLGIAARFLEDEEARRG